ncbi:MAG TPA: Uma2 family endonuclease [Bryobacteraceae bacterium]|jgi:Uma2 family endonuclease|nr:Uma2 family endonuclease [Bryobacteraceae bacterium]
MSNLAAAEFPALVSWDEFQNLPEDSLQDGEHYQLHDGQVVLLPRPRPRHKAVQMQLPRALRFVEEFDFVVGVEQPYRPAINYQFWTADVMVLPHSVMQAMMNQAHWEVYSPPLIIEILSPSDWKRQGENTFHNINKQRIVAMSNGTREFWVVDADQRTVHVTTTEGAQVYGIGDRIPCSLTPGRSVAVNDIFVL